MNIKRSILVLLALVGFFSVGWGQTRNVVLRSYEHDSIEKANLGNRKFHSAVRAYTSVADTSDIYGIRLGTASSRFTVEPLVDLSAGFQQQRNNKYLNATIGVSGTYSCSEKLTVSASLLGGYASPLMSCAMLADSIGRYPQYDGFGRSGDDYLMRYLEFYANYQPADYLMLRLGKGKKFVGDGYRSVILSASNSGMCYFDMDVNVGNFKYLFSINTAKNWDHNSADFRQMYMIYHLFSYNPARWLTLGGYETVMMIRRDSADNTKFMDLHYMNPMLFFRPLEFSLGSPDNALMGVFGKIRYLRNHLIYGQFMLDDFNLNEIKDHKGSWNNKFAIQAGLKGFLGNFSYLAEYNYIRPYIYSHDKSVNSYSMYGQPLANPYGGNLKEMVADFKYHFPRVDLELLIDHIEVGRDTDKYSMGNNVLKPYTLHKNNFDNYVGQGNNYKNLNIQMCVYYKIPQLRNFSLFARAGVQQLDGVDNGYLIMGVRTGKLFNDNSL